MLAELLSDTEVGKCNPAEIGFKYYPSAYKGTSNRLRVFPFGDLHVGSKHFNPRYIKKDLKQIDEDRENSRIIVIGDVIENANKSSVGAGVYEQSDDPITQVKKAAQIFYPYRDLIDGIVTGNHELRSYKSEQIDLMHLFACFLGLEDKYMGYSGIVGYSWNKRNYNVYVWHGAGGGGRPGSSLNKIEDQVKVVDADVYLMGHVHRKIAYKKDVFRVDSRNRKMTKGEQMFIITGSSLEWSGSYAQMAGLAPTTAGYPHFVLGGAIEGGKKIKEMWATI